MDLNLLDIDVTLGTPTVPQDAENGFFRSQEDILQAMDRYEIRRAVVRHIFGKEYNPVYGNRQLDHITSERLDPCYTLLPHHAGEMGTDEDILRNLTDRNIKFVTFCPETHHYHFSFHTCGVLLSGLSDAGIVLVLENSEIDYGNVFNICAQLPELHVVLLGVAYKESRNLYALMDVENIHVGLSRFCGMGIIKDLSDRFGPERLIFASGMPELSPAAPLANVLYADICEDSKRMIAGNNIRSMLGEFDES